MSFEPGLKPGDAVDNSQLCSIFRCSPQGGMRRSNRTNTLVLVSDHTRGIYEDRWVGKVLNYTGMGLKGDQRIDFGQNRTLAESGANGVDVFLFEVFDAGEYKFQGQVELAGDPFEETQTDADNNDRIVLIFPLRIVGGGPPTPVSLDTIQRVRQQKERQARRLNDADLLRRAKQVSGKAGTRRVSSQSYDRDPYVSEYAKRRAGGVCQLCGLPAPFQGRNDEPFLETHHIIWLSEGGEDSIENTVALCPNCHRKMHVLNLRADVQKLMRCVPR